jgi:hypothetical protein
MSAKNIARKLRKYARKLETGDVTKEEADEIYCLIHNSLSKKYFRNADFVQAVIEWYGQVEKKLPERGNYATTVPIEFHNEYMPEIEEAMRACSKKLKPADAISLLEVNEEMRLLVEEKLKGMGKASNFYISFRAGEIRQALGDMFDDLVPVIEGYAAYCGRDKFTGNIREEFEEFTADQVYGSVLAYTVYNSGVPAALIYYSLLTEYGYNNVSIVVPSKDRRMFYVPSERELFGLALELGTANEEVKKLLKGESVRSFRLQKLFEQIPEILTMEHKIENEKKTALEDDSWLDITR